MVTTLPLLPAGPVGARLRAWRERRPLSQLDLALEAGASPRHLSFVETGRASPSRDMVLLLGERLDVPLRERNLLLLAAGFAPAFPRAAAGRPRLANGAGGRGPHPARARALPGAGRRPALAPWPSTGTG